MRKVLIYGSGAVGIGIGAALYDAGWQVDFSGSKRTTEAIRKNGVKRIGIFKEVEAAAGTVGAYEKLENIESAAYDYILVCNKTIVNKQAAENLYENRHILKETGAIVIFQNGWGTDSEFIKRFGNAKVFSARIITGFARPELNISEVTVHSSPVLIGSLYGLGHDSVKALSEAIDKGGIPCQVTDEVNKALWAKMLYNCTLNPLGAVLGVSYGKLTESEDSIFIMDRIIEEIFAVIRASGHETYWSSAEDYKKEFYGSLVPNTYNHRSSTLQDIEKKIKTEIDTLTGSIVKLGQEFNVPVPYNTMIYHMVKTKESFF
ncbi:ketopantoate reductase family protein [Clostridium oryzae]|uniref:2-dehydropantoate 2-reductase n=1 Tax=Clostridium oryzae TaxID=1450648 RepID=A0A1V4J035_9CLOT|nr:ketopantoate reductase family protein [Clostridium oryzae]OPJ65027.1 2-dehydropantoate 2-reductase [Clostridium oryzae]